MSVKHANNVILACCVLHNFLRTKAMRSNEPTNFADIVEHNGNVVNGANNASEKNQPKSCNENTELVSNEMPHQFNIKAFLGNGP